jgi:hypothetical protein
MNMAPRKRTQKPDQTLTTYRQDSRDDAQHLDGCFGLLKLHIEARGSLEVVDWIVLDDWYTELKRYCEILRQAPPHAEIERQE